MGAAKSLMRPLRYFLRNCFYFNIELKRAKNFLLLFLYPATNQILSQLADRHTIELKDNLDPLIELYF